MSRLDSYFARGILSARSTLFIVIRLSVRVNQALPPAGGASAGAGLWRPALALFVVLDILVWRRLRRSTDLGLAWRLPLDLLDIVFWSSSPIPTTGHYDMVLLNTEPLAVEAGFSRGAAGLVVPAAALVAGGAARALAGRVVHPEYYAWLVLGVVLGMALWSYCKVMYRGADRAHDRLLQADRRRAYLAGQNSVAMGASSAVDALEGVVPLLGRPTEGSALWELADGFKADLGTSTRREVFYLHDVLAEWERAHNRHPELASHVTLRVAEGDGTSVITGAQARFLRAALERLMLRGDVLVRRPPGATPILGTTVRLTIGTRRLDIPADRRGAPRSIQPGAIAFGLAAADVLLGMTPNLGGVAPGAAAASVALCALAGVWAHRYLREEGQEGGGVVFAVSCVVALIMAVVIARNIRVAINVDGNPTYSFRSGALMVGFLGGMYHRAIPRHWLLVPAAVLAVCALGFALVTARTLPSAIGSLVWMLIPYPIARHASGSLAQAADDYGESRVEADKEAIAASFAAGRGAVVMLVQRAHAEATEQLRRLGPGVDPDLAAIVVRRLADAERRLAVIAPVGGAGGA